MGANALVMVLLLCLVLLLTTAPFSILSVLMVFLLLSTLIWTGWTLVQAAFGRPRSQNPSR